MFARRLIAAALAGLSLAACAGDPNTGTGPKENTGTLIGALGGAAIGEGSVIGANAVVTKNVPAGAVAVGIPAHVIKA